MGATACGGGQGGSIAAISSPSHRAKTSGDLPRDAFEKKKGWCRNWWLIIFNLPQGVIQLDILIGGGRPRMIPSRLFERSAVAQAVGQQALRGGGKRGAVSRNIVEATRVAVQEG